MLIDIRETSGNNNVIIVTKHGKCMLSEEDVRPIKNRRRRKSYRFEKDDEVVSRNW
ncbi:MAG: hypothetical protein ACLVHQ_02270 [Oscillospiraceae bacterium]